MPPGRTNPPLICLDDYSIRNDMIVQNQYPFRIIFIKYGLQTTMTDFSKHVRERMKSRGISADQVTDVMENPDDVIIQPVKQFIRRRYIKRIHYIHIECFLEHARSLD